MLREQTVSFLQAVVVFLLLTNAVSVMVTAYAVRLATAVNPKAAQMMTAVEHKVEALINRRT